PERTLPRAPRLGSRERGLRGARALSRTLLRRPRVPVPALEPDACLDTAPRRAGRLRRLPARSADRPADACRRRLVAVSAERAVHRDRLRAPDSVCPDAALVRRRPHLGFAWTGVLAGFASLYLLHAVARHRFGV